MTTTDLLVALEPSRLAALSRTPEGLRRLLAEALAYPAALRALWEGYCGGAERAALPIDDSTPYLALLASLADACLHSVEILRHGLEDAESGPDGLPALDAAADELRALRSEFVRLRDWLGAPPAPRKLPTTAEVRAALDAGECLTVEEAMAGLGSSGDPG